MSGDLPWGLVKPLGTPVDAAQDPTKLPGARPFFAYTVEENDLHFTLILDWHYGAQRLFVAERPDAVHVVYAIEPFMDQGEHDGWAVMNWGPDSAHGMLAAPLSGRPVIDATRGQPARRIRDAEEWVPGSG